MCIHDTFHILGGGFVFYINSSVHNDIMKNNIKMSHKLYADNRSIELLTLLLKRFKEAAIKKGHIPLIVVMPQLYDLKLGEKSRKAYQNYFASLGDEVSVIDTTEDLLTSKYNKYYISDQFGGHLSYEGNKVIANKIEHWLKSNDDIWNEI